jgi:hypothetical protein
MRRHRPSARTHYPPTYKSVAGRTLLAMVQSQKGHPVRRTNERRRMKYVRSEVHPVRQLILQPVVARAAGRSGRPARPCRPPLRQVGTRHRRKRRRQPGALELPQHRRHRRRCRHRLQQGKSEHGQNAQTAAQEPPLAAVVGRHLQIEAAKIGRSSATKARSWLQLRLLLRLLLRFLLRFLLSRCPVLNRCRPCQ